MTREEILNMPAGREMDAMIAEKCMGWEYKETYRTMTWELPHKKVIALFSPEGIEKTPPHYSTNIAAAWEVVEKLKIFSINAPRSTKEFYSAWCWVIGYGHENAQADTAPLAICRVALLAVMGAE